MKRNRANLHPWLFLGLERFGSVLGFVALKSAFEVVEILAGVGHGNSQIGGIDCVEREGCGPNRVEKLGLCGCEAGIIRFDVGFLRLHNLGDGIGDEAMIRMAIAAVGAPSDDDLRVKLVDEFLNIVGDSVDILGERIGDGAKFAIVEIEKDRRVDAEFSASASSFSATRSGEGFTRTNFGEVGGSFFAFGGDGEVNVNTFVRIVRESGSGEDFVVRMSKNGQKDVRAGRGALWCE
jgi:hypothetical protein